MMSGRSSLIAAPLRWVKPSSWPRSISSATRWTTSKTVWEEVSGGLDIIAKISNTEMPSRAYVGRFNFKGVGDQGKRVGENFVRR